MRSKKSNKGSNTGAQELTLMEGMLLLALGVNGVNGAEVFRNTLEVLHNARKVDTTMSSAVFGVNVQCGGALRAVHEASSGANIGVGNASRMLRSITRTEVVVIGSNQLVRAELTDAAYNVVTSAVELYFCGEFLGAYKSEEEAARACIA